MAGPEQVDRGHKKLTHREYIEARFGNAVVLAREMVRVLGIERAHAIVKDAYYREMEEMVGAELEERGPITGFEEFARREKEENESPAFRSTLTLTYPQESSTELSLHVTGCLYADVFMEMGAEELGFLMVCHPDHAYAEVSHPNIRLRRSKTLMQGDDCCDHTWFWDEGR
jgi:hypothetical protein